MKIFYLFLLYMLLSAGLYAQQEEQFTQFMYYKVGFNPAVAGSEESAVISGLVRSQWLGMEGAPQTQLLTFNMPLFNQRVGIGANVVRYTIGLSENYELNGVYSYRIRMGRGILAGGLQASVRYISTNFNNATAVQPVETDGAIPGGLQSKYVPNFGAGIYYHHLQDRFYLGVSVPRLLQNNIDLADSEDVITREVRHFYFMGGFRIPVGDGVAVRPQVLLKYVIGAPFDADLNVNVEFQKFTFGVSYRLGGSKSQGLGEAISFLLGMDLSEHFMFGLSYDLTLSELRNYNNGSVEGVVRYRFGGKSRGNQQRPVNGRDFFGTGARN